MKSKYDQQATKFTFSVQDDLEKSLLRLIFSWNYDTQLNPLLINLTLENLKSYYRFKFRKKMAINIFQMKRSCKIYILKKKQYWFGTFDNFVVLLLLF